MKSSKYEIKKPDAVCVLKTIASGENIVNLGMDIDYLLKKIELGTFQVPKILKNLVSSNPDYRDSQKLRKNCKFTRINGTWYLQATIDIPTGKKLTPEEPFPWFCTM